MRGLLTLQSLTLLSGFESTLNSPVRNNWRTGAGNASFESLLTLRQKMLKTLRNTHLRKWLI